MTTGRATGREGRSRRPPSSGRSVCSRASTSCTSLRFCNLRRPPSSPGSGRRSSSSGGIPRSTWRSSPAAPASPVPNRPQCTPARPHTGTRHRVGTGGRRHRHRERPTRAPPTRAAADPKPSPVPIQSRLLNTALRPAGRSRSKNPRARASASRDRRGPPGLMTPEGSR